MEKIISNFYRTKKEGEEVLITTEHGSFLRLSLKDYEILKKDNLNKNPKLLKKLKEKGIIIDSKNVFEIIQKQRDKKSFLMQGTSLHIIVITLRCNLKCIYCHASSKSSQKTEFDMTKETAKKTVDIIFQSPSKIINIEFQGGEPLLNFEIIEFITNYAKEKNKKIGKKLLFSITSNLIPLDKEKLDFLIKNKIEICTSIDGPKETHNKNRQEFDKTIENLNKIKKEYKKQKINLNKLHSLVTITKESLKNPKGIIDEYLKQGFKEIHLRTLNKLGDAKTNKEEIYYSPEEFIYFWEKSMNYIISLNLKDKKIVERTTKIILQKIFNKKDPNFLDLRSPCGAVIGQLLYNYDGNIYTCDEGRMTNEDLFKIGNINESFKELTTCDKACVMVAASTTDNLYCDKCIYKPYCGVCPVLNYASTNSIISNIPASSWCKIKKAQFNYIFEKMKNKKINEIFLNWIN